MCVYLSVYEISIIKLTVGEIIFQYSALGGWNNIHSNRKNKTKSIKSKYDECPIQTLRGGQHSIPQRNFGALLKALRPTESRLSSRKNRPTSWTDGEGAE